jgi:hypothetical protein
MPGPNGLRKRRSTQVVIARGCIAVSAWYFRGGTALDAGRIVRHLAAMRFATWSYRIAAIYGLLVTLPLFFTEQQYGRDHPPAVTHPEFYYGFAGLVIAWQLAFLVIGSDVVRYRPLMPVTFVEKFAFVVTAPVLVAMGRTPALMLLAAGMDCFWGVLFVAAYLKTPRRTE